MELPYVYSRSGTRPNSEELNSILRQADTLQQQSYGSTARGGPGKRVAPSCVSFREYEAEKDGLRRVEEGLGTAKPDDESVDSNFDPEAPIRCRRNRSSILASLACQNYDAAAIRAEFKTYQSILPRPDELLQGKHSFTTLRDIIAEADIKMPRFLKYDVEGGIKPHHALCSLLIGDTAEESKKTCAESWYSCLVHTLSFGYLHPQLNNPADFIRDQFDRVAHAIPTEVVTPYVLRTKIKNRGLPVPNYFLAPEDDNQFPPHIALLVILQDGEKESRHLERLLYRIVFSLFAFVAVILRMVLEVIGGAGAIWGGAELFHTLRHSGDTGNKELWRFLSIFVGVLCLLRFVTVTAPQQEDEGDILGPAGPWSLRLPVRLRAVSEHPFHYFVRALPPSALNKKEK
eukprot:CAMPEP_0113574376 /NCGR_PEP_ID=MMETSP0015_2-20120614/27115_1 /TAXON_ID=2838 /ORGANISM="Odontella" /LENGTH=401 /DNA_ID=CAMNT_0000477511 /DNA_START=44 /DNA_END=1249 /DNA_ORIENTATION=+ /assembly_acc=CAM_ASM_000160